MGYQEVLQGEVDHKNEVIKKLQRPNIYVRFEDAGHSCIIEHGPFSSVEVIHDTLHSCVGETKDILAVHGRMGWRLINHPGVFSNFSVIVKPGSNCGQA